MREFLAEMYIFSQSCGIYIYCIVQYDLSIKSSSEW